MKTDFRAILVALAATLGVGCSNDLTVPGNRCTTSAQCGNGSVCDTVHSLCVAPNASTEVVFVGSPPDGRITATAVTTTSPPQDVSTGHSVDIHLAAPRSVYGQIISATGMPVAATVRFHRQTATPAEGEVAVQSSATLQQTTDNHSFAFNAQLIPGIYDVTVTPSDLSQTPPYFYPALPIEADSNNAPSLLTITYTSPGTIVTGRVIDATTQLPMPSVPVQIVDPAAGNRIVSTVRQTSDGMGPGAAPTGTFSLWLSPGAPDSWSLQMISQPVAAATAPDVASGRLVYQVTKAALGAYGSLTGLTLRAASSLSLTGSVSGTCIACVDVQASVEGNDSTGMRQTLAGATVSLRADDVLGTLPTGHTAWFESQTTTNADGSFQARLMPGTYSAVITPPRDSIFAVTSVRLEVTRSQRGQVLTIHQLVPVIGRVFSDANGQQGVAGALIEALPLVDPNAPMSALMPVTQLARRGQVFAESDGSFAIPLDEGNYLIVVHGPDGSGLPTQLYSGTSVVYAPVNGDIDPRPVAINRGALTLSSPFAVSGAVRDSAMSLMPSSSVRAFARYRRTDGPALDVEIARTTSGSDGGYRLLLPSTVLQ